VRIELLQVRLVLDRGDLSGCGGGHHGQAKEEEGHPEEGPTG
jgi:hypothetical protein